MIKNELRYNVRNNSVNVVSSGNGSEVVEENVPEIGELNPLDALQLPKKEAFAELAGIEFKPIRSECVQEMYENDEEYLKHRIGIYTSTYKLSPTLDYGESFCGNLVNFARNISSYSTNKRVIRTMERDSSFFYRGGDLVGYIEYSRSRNSIRNALRGIFSKSYLYSSEGKCLSDHNYCVEWILNYCKENSLGFNYTKTKEMA